MATAAVSPQDAVAATKKHLPSSATQKSERMRYNAPISPCLLPTLDAIASPSQYCGA
jgi:hypothetical protein